MNRRQGFTLIELLVVISIISLLSSVAFASLNSARDKARLAVAKQFSAHVDRVAGEQAVGIWEFDECSGTTATDKSGSGGNGTLTNSPSWSANTPWGQGCSLGFNGTSQYVNVGDNANYSFDINTPFTLSAWVYPVAPFSAGGSVLSKDTQSTSRYHMGLTGDVRLQCNVSGTTGGGWYYGSTYLPLNKWAFIACAYDGSGNASGLSLYVNGALDGKGSNSALTGTMRNSIPVQIGARTAGLAPFFTGQIDGVRAFAKALTASEVGRLYAQGAAELRLASGE